METSNVQPDANEWTLVATSPGYIRIKSNALSESRYWYVAVTDGGEPDEEVTGEKYLGTQLWEVSGVIGEIYILTKRDDDDFAITIGESSEGGGGGSPLDKELVVTTYRVKTGFTGASIGDILTLVQVIDVSGAEVTTASTRWRNHTTGLDLGSAPSATNIELVGSQGITNAELRSAAIQIIEKDDPFTIAGRTVDPLNNVVFNYTDGTSETFFYTTAGDLAGKGVRE